MAGKLGSLLKSWTTGDDVSTFAAAAERLRRQGQLPRAIEVCREGLKKFPEQLSARVTLGWALLELGDYDEAREELEYVIRRAPDNLAAIRGLAELHDRSENAALLALEHGGDWPPRQEDIERAVTEQRDRPAAAEPADRPVVVDALPDVPRATAPEPQVPGANATSEETLPESAVELLEEAEALEALADEEDLAGSAGTLDLDPSAEVDLDELVTELASPENRIEQEQSGAPVAESAPGEHVAVDGGEPIVLDAESMGGDLDDLVELGSGRPEGEAAEDEPAGQTAPESDVASVRTESTLDALERLLNQVKARRHHVTSNSAA